jgi:hypothetical protein
MRKAVLPLLLALAVVSAGCFQINFSSGPDGNGPPTTTGPTLPGGLHLPAYVDSVDLLQLESWPVQIRALVKGSLPTPCHTLAWTLSGPDADGRITLDVYSTADPDAVCTQVLQSFEESIPIGSFTSGSFVLVVNGVEYPFTI